MNRFWQRSSDEQSLEALSDGDLVELAKNDQAAFGVLYERHVARIYRYVYYRTGNQHDAEDLTARVFYRAMGHIKNYTDRGLPFQAWLYRIAHNLVANWHRDRGRRKVIPLEEFVGVLETDSPAAFAEDEEEREMLLAAIRRLAPERQQLLVLKFVEHLSNAEIGEIMGRTEGAIKSLYHRTLIALREDLEKTAGDTPNRNYRRSEG